MKKSIFLLSLIFISSDIQGMIQNRDDNSFSSSEKSLKTISLNPENFITQQQPNTREASSSNKSLNQESSHKRSLQLDPEIEKKINSFSKRLKNKTYEPDLVRNALIEYCTKPDVSINKIAEKYGIQGAVLYGWKRNAGLFLRRKGSSFEKNETDSFARTILDAKMKEKIHNFAQNKIKHYYSTKQIEDALIDWITYGYNKSNSISTRSLHKWGVELGISCTQKDLIEKNRKNEEMLLSNLNYGINWNDIHKTVGKNQRNTRRTLGKLQEKGRIEIHLTEQQKDYFINLYRKRLYTHKGISEKFGIKESEVFCILHEARKNGKDLSAIKINWPSKYVKANDVPNYLKEKIIEDYNKSLLTLLGISVKYKLPFSLTQYILFKKNTNKIEKRNGARNKDSELVFDLKNKTNQEIEQKYKYKAAYIDDLKRYINHWEYLTDDQRNLFKTTIKTKIMPSEDVLCSIKKSCFDSINEKFKKLLFVLLSTRDEIMYTLNISRSSVNRLVRNVNFWKILAQSK